eukprot:TRINITY_DN34485_c0_g1_i1.p1 TRINITY_DN34485_c0_g1~~TRINITY_DN34485_c0_g1_i1.p1  ORF type:complete len:411 (-),score=56.72 TRINITY_DN34485_c0_g1_i1:127-1359(-)
MPFPRTLFTTRFRCNLPIIVPNMAWVSTPAHVAAVCNAGALGVLSTTGLSPLQTSTAIADVRSMLSDPETPFGVGCTLSLPGSAENVEIAMAADAPVLAFSHGDPRGWVDSARARGIQVISAVQSVRHAAAASDAGVDAIMVVGSEAAGGGSDCGLLPLLRACRHRVGDNMPVIAAGGITSGAQIGSALVAGADAVGMGTRFACTLESPMAALAKGTMAQGGVANTFQSHVFGPAMAPVRVFRAPGAERVAKVHATARGRAVSRAAVTWKAMVTWRERMRVSPSGALAMLVTDVEEARRHAWAMAVLPRWEAAIVRGDMLHGVLPCGAGVGNVLPRTEDLPVGEVLAQLVADYESAMKRVMRWPATVAVGAELEWSRQGKLIGRPYVSSKDANHGGIPVSGLAVVAVPKI